MGLFALHILQSPYFIIPWLPLRVNDDFGRCLILPILRSDCRKDFLITPKAIYRDANLSLRDMGLLCLMLSKPDGWSFSIKGLAAITGRDGRDAIAASAQNLEKNGYLIRTQERSKDGKLGDWVWIIRDTPETACPVSALPNPEKPAQNKNRRDIEQTKGKSASRSTSQRFVQPDVEEVDAYATKIGVQLNAAAFVDFYASKGWKVGRSPMKDWKAAVRNWARRSGTSQTISQAEDAGSDFELIEVGGVKQWRRKQ